MFKVRVCKTIWNKEKKEVHAILHSQQSRRDELNSSSYYYDIMLEFPPFVDLELTSESWSSATIKRVSWDAVEKQFYCYSEDEFPSLSNDLKPHGPPALNFDEDFLKSKSLREGWRALTAFVTP